MITPVVALLMQDAWRLCMDEKIYSVSEINSFISDIFDRDTVLRNVQVQGEVSNFKRYPSGHCYFTLKDKGGVLKAVMFCSRAASLRFEPQNGDTVIAVGRIGVFERDGVYQLYTDLLLQQGAGDLMLAFEQLKIRLEAEGLFAEEHKKQLPLNPHCIGIVTSSAGAAVRDIITVSRRRNPGIKLILYPVKVQGEGAAAEIAKAISFFNKQKLADVLIVGRGGGSIEELWAFNEEKTVRAVAASKIPIISAVGHETDFTLCDFAADKRAATPSQAAEIAVADTSEYNRRIENLRERCCAAMQKLISYQGHELEKLNNSWALKDPERLFADKSLQTDAAVKNLLNSMEKRLQNSKHQFEVQAARLDSLSPLAVLKRGYTVTQDSDYKIVTSAAQVRWGDELVTTVADGKIISIVQSAERR